MNALQQGVKGQLAAGLNDKFAIEHKTPFAELPGGSYDLRKIASQVLARF
jgi:hypothetical protein